MTNPSRLDGLVSLGRIAGLLGVQGWVKVFSYARPRESILSYTSWLVQLSGAWCELTVTAGRVQGKSIVVKLNGYDDREQASRLIGAEIALRAEQMPALKQGEYYWAQLEGLKVVNLSGQELGTVDHLLETGANDVMVVRNGQERLIPAAAQVIREVDLAAGLIRVDWDADF